VLVPLAEKATAEGYTYYVDGLDVISWLNGSKPRPSVDYLASIPVSLPVIGITQLIQYVVSARIADVTPGDLREIIKGATGHSQGIISAVAVAASTSWESLEENIAKAVKFLFYIGLRGQEFFPLLSLDPEIVADANENNEGTPTPMLAVNGLSRKALEGHIEKVNKFLPENSKVGISLFNAATMFIVTGPAKSLYGLATALRKVQAPAGLDQGRVPFSQRKSVFTIRFLPINVPYHSDYLIGATDKLLAEDLKDTTMFKASDLGMPIFNTEDGKLGFGKFADRGTLSAFETRANLI
jgi:fatty acid synthase subunit beta